MIWLKLFSLALVWIPTSIAGVLASKFMLFDAKALEAAGVDLTNHDPGIYVFLLCLVSCIIGGFSMWFWILPHEIQSPPWAARKP